MEQDATDAQQGPVGTLDVWLRNIFDDPTLGRDGKFVGVYLLLHLKDDACVAPLEAITAALNIRKDSVSGALQIFVDRGLFRRWRPNRNAAFITIRCASHPFWEAKPETPLVFGNRVSEVPLGTSDAIRSSPGNFELSPEVPLGTTEAARGSAGNLGSSSEVPLGTSEVVRSSPGNFGKQFEVPLGTSKAVRSSPGNFDIRKKGVSGACGKPCTDHHDDLDDLSTDDHPKISTEGRPGPLHEMVVALEYKRLTGNTWKRGDGEAYRQFQQAEGWSFERFKWALERVALKAQGAQPPSRPNSFKYFVASWKKSFWLEAETKFVLAERAADRQDDADLREDLKRYAAQNGLEYNSDVISAAIVYAAQMARGRRVAGLR